METDFTGERAMPGMQGPIVAEHLHRYAIASQLVRGRRVLDIASGDGYGSALMAESAVSVVGVDVDDQTVAHATSRYALPNLRFMQGDCARIPLADSSVDVVVSFETIEHHAKHAEMMAEVRRVLVAGGLFICSTPDKAVYSDARHFANPFHVKELSRNEFDSLLRSHFTNVVLLEQRIITASVVLGDGFGARVYSGDFTRLSAASSLPGAMYLIGLSSDDDLPPIDAASLFETQPVIAEQLDAMRKSLSWRLTAPLRWIGDVLTGRHR